MRVANYFYPIPLLRLWPSVRGVLKILHCKKGALQYRDALRDAIGLGCACGQQEKRRALSSFHLALDMESSLAQT